MAQSPKAQNSKELVRSCQVVPKAPDSSDAEAWQCFLRGVGKFLALGSPEDVISYPTLRQAWLSKGDVSCFFIYSRRSVFTIGFTCDVGVTVMWCHSMLFLDRIRNKEYQTLMLSYLLPPVELPCPWPMGLWFIEVLFVPAGSVIAEKALLCNNMCLRTVSGLMTKDSLRALMRAVPFFPAKLGFVKSLWLVMILKNLVMTIEMMMAMAIRYRLNWRCSMVVQCRAPRYHPNTWYIPRSIGITSLIAACDDCAAHWNMEATALSSLGGNWLEW